MGKKGVPAEEKRKRMLEYFYETVRCDDSVVFLLLFQLVVGVACV